MDCKRIVIQNRYDFFGKSFTMVPSKKNKLPFREVIQMKKMTLLKKAFPVFLTTAMILGMSVVSMAKPRANKKELLAPFDVHLSYSLQHGMGKNDVEIDYDENTVRSGSVSSVSNTDYGKKPKVTLKFTADSDYTFKGLRKEDVAISGDEASVSKVTTSGSNGRTLTLTLTLPRIGSTDGSALEINDVSWSDENDGNVEWEQADVAEKYEIKFLRGSSTKETITTQNTQYNFRDLIRANGKGSYRVKVRGLVGSYKGDWTESDDFDVDEDILKDLGGKTSGSGNSNSGPSNSGSAKGAWLKDNNGWWYCNADRSYTTNNWQQIDGYWYYFNQQGYMKTGWLQSPFSNKWYWLSTDSGSTQGRMLTNQWVDNGKYYVDGNGVWNGQSR